MTVNIFVPVDPNMINSAFNLNDTLDDEPEKLERYQYFVSKRSNYKLDCKK